MMTNIVRTDACQGSHIAVTERFALNDRTVEQQKL
jgi:hypothetical protein